MSSCTSLRLLCLSVIAALLGLVYSPAHAQITNVGVQTKPIAAAVNPVTNTIYVANNASANVTVIDGATNDTTTVTTGTNPTAIGVNSATNMIYVANAGSATVTVINGSTFFTNVDVGRTPTAVAVNPVTNTIYVANYGSNSISVIDGGTNAVTTTVTTASNSSSSTSGPTALAVNPVTNQLYVSCYGGGAAGALLTIDGASNTVSSTTYGGGGPGAGVAVNPVTNTLYWGSYTGQSVTEMDSAGGFINSITVGTAPEAIAVNPVTNHIYVANYASANVSVIDGATNTVAAIVTAGTNPSAIALNATTNTIYVANNGSGSVTVIDGATNAAATASTGQTNPCAVAVNPVTGRAYVANTGSNNVTVLGGATNATSTINIGARSVAAAVNPVTNTIYVVNNLTDTVTVINGATNSATSMSVGALPIALVVNPATNTIYVVNENSFDVSVIDGATNTVAATVSTGGGSYPMTAAVNPVTNQVYVVNGGNSSVSVIDGATNTVSATVSTDSEPQAVAVNPVTNMIYVANSAGNDVTVIDGTTNATATVNAGSFPDALVVNPVTNMIYVANNGSNNMTVIDGANNATTTVSVPIAQPDVIAVNPVTDKIYLGNESGNTVAVIDGVTNAVSTANIGAGSGANCLTVNLATNQIYVATGSNNVTVIDGATNTTATLSVGNEPDAIALNPVTNQIYVADFGDTNVTVITPVAPASSGLATAITPLPGNVTFSATPTISFQATSLYGPTAPPIQQIWYQLDTETGPWQPLSPVNGGAIATLANLATGAHTIYAFAADGQESTSVNAASSPIIGQVSAYYFVYADATPVASSQTVDLTTGVPASITLTGSGPGALSYSVVTPPRFGGLSGTGSQLTYTPAANFAGRDSFTFTVSANGLVSAPATVSLLISPPVYFPGRYVGLISGTTAAESGSVSITESGTGAFTGSISYGGVTYALKGAFNAGGVYMTSIKPKGGSALAVILQAGLIFGEDAIIGAVGGSSLLAANAIFSQTLPTPLAGKYTVQMPADPTQTDGSKTPQGYSVGTLVVSPAGSLALVGALADGTKFSQGSYLTRDGAWYLFTPLYAKTSVGEGMLTGTIQFESTSRGVLDGGVTWIRPKLTVAHPPATAVYPNGFTLATNLYGAAYTPRGSLVLTPASASNTFHAEGGSVPTGSLSEAATAAKAAASFKVTGADSLSVTVTEATGFISGTFKESATSPASPINAVIYQNGASPSIIGWFTDQPKGGTNEGGTVTLTSP